MVFLIIGLIALGSLTADRLVWLRLRAQWPAQRWPRRVYGVVMGLCYAAVAVALAFFRAKSDGESTRALHWILWAIGLFCVVTLPKLFILLGAGVDGVRWRFVRSPRRVGFRVGVWCALLCLGVMVWGVTGGRNRIVERPVTLTSSRLPAAFDGYRILFFSDVHIGNLPANGRFLRRVVARVERAQPDLVLCGGDLVNIDVRELTDSVQATLSQIHAPDGVWSVLGNHDLGGYMHRGDSLTPRCNVERLVARQEAMGWQVLRNQTVILHRAGDSVTLTGVDFPTQQRLNARQDVGFVQYDPQAAYRGVCDSLFNILLSHTPQVWPEVLRYGAADLTLSGHVHAMQMKLKIGQWAWSPARWLYRQWSGAYYQGDKMLYVNDGLGYVLYPMRIGASAELTILTLRRAK